MSFTYIKLVFKNTILHITPNVFFIFVCIYIAIGTRVMSPFLLCVNYIITISLGDVENQDEQETVGVHFVPLFWLEAI